MVPFHVLSRQIISMKKNNKEKRRTSRGGTRNRDQRRDVHLLSNPVDIDLYFACEQCNISHVEKFTSFNLINVADPDLVRSGLVGSPQSGSGSVKNTDPDLQTDPAL